jgi:Domain of unknown function (DUF4844)
MMKFFAMIVGALALLVFVGVSGLLFRVWPTFWPDQDLKITSIQIEQLKQLRAEVKFHEDLKTFYPGATDEFSRLVLESAVNGAVDSIIQLIEKNPEKSYVLGVFKWVLGKMERLDTEDQEQVLAYFSRVLDILGIESSNELFNVWRYGVPYGWFMKPV